jgi:DNA-3-methyladenine glycosylase I
MKVESKIRCHWPKNELAVRYHDEEWGVPVHEDRKWYEFIVLDGAQAGLSWDTVLRKRENYRKAFDGFDPARVARYDKRKLERLLADPGIIRNRMKINSAISNAKAFLHLQEELGGFDEYIWTFVDGAPKINRWKSPKEIPTHTPISDVMSKDLKQRGFNFVGTTICYAFMQAAGMVNDHLVACFRHGELCGNNESSRRSTRARG